MKNFFAAIFDFILGPLRQCYKFTTRIVARVKEFFFRGISIVYAACYYTIKPFSFLMQPILFFTKLVYDNVIHPWFVNVRTRLFKIYRRFGGEYFSRYVLKRIPEGYAKRKA